MTIMQIININGADAVAQLEKLADSIRAAYKAVDRKRWRDSEKAMTRGDYARKLEAIAYAIKAIKRDNA